MGSKAVRQIRGLFPRIRQWRHDSQMDARDHWFNEMDAAELPKISIVTPSYNQARFLETCIQSVLSQGYPRLEYIILDGGSSDDSVDIIKKHEADITFWRSRLDKGQSDAINEGFERSTGDLVAWLNADDFYLPGAFAMAGRTFSSRPEASFYFGNGWRVDETGNFKSPFFKKNHIYFNRNGLIYGLNYILQPSSFINRRVLFQVGLLDTGLRYGMDTDLWIRLSNLASPQPISGFLSASREYDDTKTAKGSFERVEELRQIASKYSGAPMTPGVLCYFLDTLYQSVGEREEIFDRNFQKSLRMFWAETARLLSKFGCSPEGFPVSGDPEKFRSK
ncbi:MAG: glycosyltransferase family 2 protein [Deltaproteobacteria bacterium]|nr:glycosyltransferase family 2 protein [Deltaproteobacteria bacterium]